MVTELVEAKEITLQDLRESAALIFPENPELRENYIKAAIEGIYTEVHS